MLKLWILMIFVLLGLAGLVFFAQIRLAILTAFFLWDLLDEGAAGSQTGGALAWVTSQPSVEQLQIAHREENIAADLYQLNDGKRRAAILLTHGIIESGKDDPRLIRFAYSLARVGFVVLVPELKGMKSFRILLSDVDDIVASFQYLASLQERVDRNRMGLLGFSYGAGPTILAAADPSIRDSVKFLVSFGGYYDPINVIRFITTGTFEYKQEQGFQQPEPYGKWVFFINNVDYVEDQQDRKLLREIFEKEEKSRREDVKPLLNGLTPQGRFLYELLINEDPDRVEGLVKQTDPRFQDYLHRLGLASVVPTIRAYMIIGHGSSDPLIPYTESLRLADAVPDKRRVNVAVLKLFTHVDPARRAFSVKQFFTVFLPSLGRFYYLVYDLLRQQR